MTETMAALAPGQRNPTGDHRHDLTPLTQALQCISRLPPVPKERIGTGSPRPRRRRCRPTCARTAANHGLKRHRGSPLLPDHSRDGGRAAYPLLAALLSC